MKAAGTQKARTRREADALPRTMTEECVGTLDDQQAGHKRTRPTHKRTLSDSSLPTHRPADAPLPSTQRVSPGNGHSTERPGSPSLTDEDLSETELMIRRIIRQKGKQDIQRQVALLVEEAPASEEEDSDADGKQSLSVFRLPIERLLQHQSAQRELLTRRRRALMRQLLSLLPAPSQRPTPLMSLVLTDTFRASTSSVDTVTGPGGSFHV